jgi:hypothetical protein
MNSKVVCDEYVFFQLLLHFCNTPATVGVRGSTQNSTKSQGSKPSEQKLHVLPVPCFISVNEHVWGLKTRLWYKSKPEA